jgi:hypothetical protein
MAPEIGRFAAGLGGFRYPKPRTLLSVRVEHEEPQTAADNKGLLDAFDTRWDTRRVRLRSGGSAGV